MKMIILISFFCSLGIWSNHCYSQNQFVQKDLSANWIELKRTSEDFAIYDPCDGQTPKIEVYEKFIVFHGQLESPDTLIIEKFFLDDDSRLAIKTKHILDNNAEFDIRIKWVDKSRQIAYWNFKIKSEIANHSFAVLMIPNKRQGDFKKVDNPCPDGKIDEKEFENIDNLR